MNTKYVERIKGYTASAKGIAFDTCHKIYILMDDAQMEQMKDYGYDPLISSSVMTADEMTDTVVGWFEESCALRFVSAVSTVDGFESVIGQGEVEEGECSSCGEDISEDYSAMDGMCESCLRDEHGYCCDCGESFYEVEQAPDGSHCQSCYEQNLDEDERLDY